MGLLKGLAVGAGAMYLLDPDQGNERCERLREGFKERLGEAKQNALDAVKDFPPAGKAVVCGALLLGGMARRGLVGGLLVAAGAAGLASLVRGAGGSSSQGARSRRGGSGVMIDAPVEQVFEFFMNPENFARVLDRIKQVKNVGQGVSQWTLDDDTTPVHWESALTRVIPNERIEWHSTPGSSVESFGEISCEPRKGGTLLHLSVVARWPTGDEDELFHDEQSMKSVIEEEIVHARQ